MDEVIFEEFTGTGNSELNLERRAAAEKADFPSYQYPKIWYASRRPSDNGRRAAAYVDLRKL